MTDTQPVSSVPRRHDLTSASGASWTVRPSTDSLPEPESRLVGQNVAATVPGEIHVDLLRAGLIPDPFDADHESRLAWIGRTGWTYSGTFSWSDTPASRHDLVVEGLDTVATIILNGTEVGRTANQHRQYRFDVGSLLVPGSNDLVIDFEAPVTAAERLAAELGDRPRAYGHPFNAIRKMASSYGWDWGPDLAGAGIWQPIAIESWSAVRFAAVRPLATVAGSDGVLQVEVDLDWADGAAVEDAQVSVAIAGSDGVTAVVPGQQSATVHVVVPNADLWWPRGYGEPARYPVTVQLLTGEQQLDSFATSVGFRSVRLSTAPDDLGSEFVILVNDEPIFVRGANWIPDDALITRVNRSTYAASLADAVAAGMNLLRVWGGGRYESEDFYEQCDELGILVWQDFLFACAAYSEDEPLRSEVEAEARQAVTRLCRHPSLVVWNGNNENIWGYVEWGWRQRLGDRSWGDGYYTELLPELVASLDPRVVYTPGSPFSFAKYHHPNDHRHGTMHVWDVWNVRDYRHYRDYPARFVAEFGFQGPPAWSTLVSVVHDEPMDPYGPQMLIHQKAADGNLKLERGLGNHLPRWSDPPGDLADWHWITSLNQARAVAYGVEHFRSWYPINRGSVVWQLNDNWPVISWAAVDGHGIRKPLWYALRRVNADRLLTLQPRPDGTGRETLALIGHNDSAEPWQGEIVLHRRSTVAGSQLLAEQRVPFQLDPRTAATFPLDPAIATPDDPTRELITAAAAGAETAFGYFVEDTELVLEPPADAYEVLTSRTDEGWAVTVSARALVKDATLFPDRLDPAARVDSALVTILAGQSHTFAVSAGTLDEVALTAPPVLRTVNDLIGRPAGS